MTSANTTSRIVYDTLAQEIDDQDRLLVCEVPADAVWYNLRCENDPADRRTSLRREFNNPQ